jgi:hypothetical protein
VRETGGIDGEPYGLEADAFASDVIRAAFVAAATPYLRAFRPLDGLCALLAETARCRLDALPLAAVVAQIAAMGRGSCWHWRATCARGWCPARSRRPQRWRSGLYG